VDKLFPALTYLANNLLFQSANTWE
jgi:hypothetical protein